MLSNSEKKERRRLYFAKWYSRRENKLIQNARSTAWSKTQKAKDRAKIYRKSIYVPKIRPLKKERFLKYVEKRGDSDCWEWTGARYKNGYGHFNNGRESGYAHRLSFSLFRGPVPKRKHVCHSCDNPPCVNPSHLWIGTAKDNAMDRQKKGRGRR